MIIHRASYSAISNMDLLFAIEGDDQTTSVFLETSLISPSSLSFFISGYKKIVTDTRSGITHIVSVRESEDAYTEMLFTLTDIILESVESFLDNPLPIDTVLHSVVLPGYENEFGAFYGFNYYR